MTLFINPSPNPLDTGSYEIDTRATPSQRFGVSYEPGFVSYVYDRRRRGWVFAGFGPTPDVAAGAARFFVRGALRAAERRVETRVPVREGEVGDE